MSIQGEAGQVGRPHVFLRLGGCPLRCGYCDTQRSWQRIAQADLHLPGAAGSIPNPLSATELDDVLLRLTQAHRLLPEQVVLSVTGGEPLAQATFLEHWLPTWPGPVLLETAGIFADRLESLLPHLDYLSLDWKDPADLVSGASMLEPAACLELADKFSKPLAGSSGKSGLTTWVKFILHQQTDSAWLGDSLKRIARLKRGISVYLQPVTACSGGLKPPDSSTLLAELIRWHDLPLDLRVLPQIHPLLGVR